ncbi:glycosyl hydrolase [Paracnuella aquatica]|uniref:glycosyl hydrolase n=1 Tax=Paracnuella aquatica TaxID=2268757 RepID=UPI000DEEEB1D|nr:glycosyl hydrolase [Paracnuella aquatica]RPD51485.1 glycoside hydrolase family 2 protein [Paracnuella aquatica]
MLLKKCFFAIACLLAATVHAQVEWPAITQQSKPWARWWWQGSAVNRAGLEKNMKDYAAAGLGGLEITPIYGVQGAEQQFIPFLSNRWMDMLQATLAMAKNLGLGIDMANGTGWPFGGPTIKDSHASKTLFHKTWQLNGVEIVGEPVTFAQQSFVRTANNQKVIADTILQDIAQNKDLQALALDQVQFSKTLRPFLLMAYPEKGQPVDVTSKVDANGNLVWTAPAAKWQLVGLYEGLHGKMVERAAPGGEGYAIDHFSAAALDHYLSRFDTAFAGRDLTGIRAFFNDSYEVDDARGQSNWTPNFLAAFRQRRGYDLAQHLPALLQQDATDKNRRVLYDYRATIDEMILKHFTKRWKGWGSKHGKSIRNQSHGSPANLLDLYAAIDIPETEGSDILRFKFATSAAHVAGKKLASAEAATWLNEHFLSGWGDVKKALDLFMLAGVNHIFYHGVNYSPPEAAWPGWLFYAAVHFNQANPQWKDFGALNKYVARCQSFLQMGNAANDVLLYFPLPDRYMEPGKELLQHFDGLEKNFEGSHFEHAAKRMQEAGYLFDFISDRQLAATSFQNGIKTSGIHTYKTILLPANKYISDTTFQHLVQLTKQGATILLYKNAPEDVPGFYQLEQRRKLLQTALSQLKFAQADGAGVRAAIVGKGKFLMADDIDALLAAGGIKKEEAAGGGIQLHRRNYEGGSIYFLRNDSSKAFNGWLTLRIPGATTRSVALFNPMTGQKGLAETRKGDAGAMQVYVQLKPYETCIVQTFDGEQKGELFPYRFATGQPQEIIGTWRISFEKGGPELPQPVSKQTLSSWAHWGDITASNFSGTARYSINFSKPQTPSKTWWLDLGQVDETAEVFLNGTKLATLIGPQYGVEIAGVQLQPTNKLEVLVSNLMANRIRYMERHGLQWKKFYNINMSARNRSNLKNGVFDASHWEPQSSGLLGPVTLTPTTGVFPKQ